MKNLMNWFISEESGQGMVEYALILALVAIIVAGFIPGVTTKIGELFTKIASKL